MCSGLSLVIHGWTSGDDFPAGARTGMFGATASMVSDRLTGVVARGLLGTPSSA
jgi:hypothetical protein